MKYLLTTFAVLFFSIFVSAQEVKTFDLNSTVHPQTLLLNRQGNELLKKQSFSAAMENYIEALKYSPYQAELYLNLGLSFEGLQQADKALLSYKRAEELALHPFVKFMSLFNQAQLLGKDKKVDEALELYRRALEIIPDSKEAKTNIELLTQDQQGGGQGQDEKDKKDDSKDSKKDPKENKDNKDKKDQDKDDKDKPDKQDQKKDYEQSAKYKPRKFDSKDLGENDVKKILGELRQQEQKIRAEFNRKEVKERPRDKDW